jgi:phytanoyl-CoA hydroxylase
MDEEPLARRTPGRGHDEVLSIVRDEIPSGAWRAVHKISGKLAMIELQTPRGLPVQVPQDEHEDKSPKFDASDLEGFGKYYEENGYAIIRGLLDPGKCDRIRTLWESEVKPFDGFMYRQATAKLERHVKNDKGWIMNPILNLQSVNPSEFPEFRDYATNQILTDHGLRLAFEALLRDTPKIVQSMYFEGNSATWEHQDSYYLDSETVGEMTAAWIAIEDISAKAGRFFICPRSHKLKLDDHTLYNNIAENHDGYINSVVQKIRDEKLEIRAPVLRKGDVLFWNAWTIHGSLASQDACSRSSITCHAIPTKKLFLQLQTRKLDLQTDCINEVDVYRPKDLSRARNRAIFYVESRYPKAFYWLKKQAILYSLKHKAA